MFWSNLRCLPNGGGAESEMCPWNLGRTLDVNRPPTLPAEKFPPPPPLVYVPPTLPILLILLFLLFPLLPIPPQPPPPITPRCEDEYRDPTPPESLEFGHSRAKCGPPQLKHSKTPGDLRKFEFLHVLSTWPSPPHFTQLSFPGGCESCGAQHKCPNSPHT